MCNNNKTIVLESKNNQTKEVFVSEQNRNKLSNFLWAEEWFKQQSKAPVLRTETGKTLCNRYSIMYYNNLLKPYGEKHKLKLQTHSFRISLVTELLKSSDVNVVKDIIGHKNISTTLRYNRGTTPDKKKVEALNQVM